MMLPLVDESERRWNYVGLVGGQIGYRLLNSLAKVSPGNEITTAYDGKSKMEVFFGPEIWDELADKTVADFGCDEGIEAVVHNTIQCGHNAFTKQAQTSKKFSRTKK